MYLLMKKDFTISILGYYNISSQRVIHVRLFTLSTVLFMDYLDDYLLSTRQYLYDLLLFKIIKV